MIDPTSLYKKYDTPTVPRRFYSLDATRGVAALGIVVWHWQHFFSNGIIAGKDFMVRQPLYFLLFPFYEKGYYAVYLFFCLSGFIFYWLYSKGIQDGSTSGKEFFLKRFSRLYPLHFLTLILVLVGQKTSLFLTGTYFVYPYNDLWHFVLNFFFVTFWGLQAGPSYNAPIWSVSVEVLLYIIFFIFSSRRGTNSILFTGLIVLFGMFLKSISTEVSIGIFSFFAGGMMFLLYKRVIKLGMKVVLVPLSLITLSLWILTITSIRFDMTNLLLQQIQSQIYKYISPAYNFTVIVLFPLTILTLALVETYRGKLGSRIKFLGDISYSTYLWHFPLQLMFVLLLPILNIGNDFYFSKTALFLFFGLLIIISYLSYNFFERPVQNYIRKRFGSRLAGVNRPLGSVG